MKRFKKKKKNHNNKYAELYLFGAVHVVPEREEGIRAQSNRLEGAQPVLTLRLRQLLRNLLKHGLPCVQVWALTNTHTHTFRKLRPK